jgi:hypothetical protein
MDAAGHCETETKIVSEEQHLFFPKASGYKGLLCKETFFLKNTVHKF